MSRSASSIAVAALGAAVLAGVLSSIGAHLQVRGDLQARIGALAGASLPARASDPCAQLLLAAPVPAAVALASWQTFGGCGAGASSGSGAGVKWIGRNVRGGLFRVECQATYTETPYGGSYVGTSLITAEAGDSWNIGAAIPYVYKYMADPYGQGFDVRNRGLGDVSVLVTSELGPIGATAATLMVNLPTGRYDDTLVRDTSVILPQDRQLGLGKFGATAMLDHTIDNLWGPTVVGGLVSWRGGENPLGSYRAPSASMYAHASYLMGPLAPSAGLQVTGFAAHDRDRTVEQSDSPLVSVSGQVGLEWASDVVAVLLAASFPYDYQGEVEQANGLRQVQRGFGPWTLALGLAFAPF